MKSMIAVVFIALAVAAVNAGIIASTPLVASSLAAPLVSSPVIAARSLVASPWSGGIIAAPGIGGPLALSHPAVLPAAATIW